MSAQNVVTEDDAAGVDASTAPAAAPPAPAKRRARSDSPADRFMRRLLRVPEIEPTKRHVDAAQGAFRTSLIVSGVRCIVMYLAVPILVPIAGLAEWFAAPIGIVLCFVAFASGIYSVRRFFLSDHRYRWMYAGFIAFVFAVLIFSLVSDISRLVTAL
ncbi:MAG: hypothetical protein ACTH31_09830 [Pseudoclavibacter sp.]